MAGPFGRVTEDALHLEFTNTPGPSPGDHVVETRLAPVRNHVHSLRSALERAQADTIRTTPAGELNEHILSVIRATGRATARAPRTHAGWGEKDRRQTVLKLAASTAELDEEQQRHPAGRRTAACSDWRLEGSGCAPKLLGRRALALQARRAQRLDWARRVGDPSSTSLTCLRIPMRLSKHLVRYCVSRRVLDPGPCKQCAASATAAAIDQQRPSHKLAPDCRFARPDVPELTIELPRKEAPGARRRPRPVAIIRAASAARSDSCHRPAPSWRSSWGRVDRPATGLAAIASARLRFADSASACATPMAILRSRSCSARSGIASEGVARSRRPVRLQRPCARRLGPQRSRLHPTGRPASGGCREQPSRLLGRRGPTRPAQT
jgi:hypothetical protein